jgi:hypothetical protein
VQGKQTETVLAALLEANVLQERESGVELTEEFRSLAQGRERGATDAVPHVDTVVDQPGVTEADEERICRYAATLEEFGVELPGTELVAAAASIARLDRDPADGKPDWGSVTVGGDELRAIVDANEDVLALIERDDCDPCDRVRSKLATLREEGALPPEVVLVDVPGRKHRRLLYEQFDVVGAPTLLFFHGGSVEMRLTGDVHRKQLRSDLGRVYD